jgi:hypothetical protein
MAGIREQLTKLKDGLRIDKHALDAALMQQPQLYLEVSELVATAIARRDYLKEELTQIDAKLSRSHRHKIEKETGKATEAQVAHAVAVDPQHWEAFEKHNEAKKTADLAGGLKDAFHQRRYMLQELCGLFVASYFQTDTMGVNNNNTVQDYRAEKNRNAMAEKRNVRKRE